VRSKLTNSINMSKTQKDSDNIRPLQISMDGEQVQLVNEQESKEQLDSNISPVKHKVYTSK